MKGTLTSHPELFSELSWNLLLLGEETAKKWGHNEFNIEHVIQTLFTANQFASFTDKLSIDHDAVLDVTEDFLDENTIDSSEIMTIGEDLEILLDNAFQIKSQWGSNLIEIPHLLIAIGRDKRIGNYVFDQGNLSTDKLEAELKLSPNIIPDNPQKDLVKNSRDIQIKTAVKENFNNLTTKGSESSNSIQTIGSQMEIIENEDAALRLYGKDLTEKAELCLLDPVIGREKEINNLMRILSRRNKNNPVLIGNPGVGKTAIVKLLAQLISKRKVAESLRDLRIISLDFGALVSGTKFRGQLEERLRAFFEELKNYDKGVILFIDEIHTIINSDRSSADISSLLKPLLTDGNFRCIGTTTPEKFRETIEKDQALSRCFQQILVNEPSVELSAEILLGIKKKYELHHGIRITKDAINNAAKLSNRYISDKNLPDKAIDLIDEAAAQLKIQLNLKPQKIIEEEQKLEKINSRINNLSSTEVETEALLNEEKEVILENIVILKEKWIDQQNKLEHLGNLLKEEDLLIRTIENNPNSEHLNQKKNELSKIQYEIKYIEDNFKNLNINNTALLKYKVEPDDIADVVAKTTGIPVSKVVSNERKKLINLEKEISEKVIGQAEAILAVSSAIRRARAGMKNPKRPIGSFLFMGPTGVGKTELAKSLASSLFDEAEALIRLDMSEYMERNAVARLLGAPPGYVGYEEGGQLTEAVRRKPYSVILLDEIEKAHSEVYNILLQVIDEGRLTDSQGRTVNFKNTVIIMTSNLASQEILKNAEELEDKKVDLESVKKNHEEIISKSLAKNFRPEFLNRIDEIVQFDPLSIDQLQKIILLQVADLQKLLLEQDIKISIDKKVIKKIALDSYEPQYGARPLIRELRRQIENPLATKLLENNFKNSKNISIRINPSNKNMISFSSSS